MVLFITSHSYAKPPEEPKPLAIGSQAPDFALPGVDGKNYSLSSFKDAKVLAVVFTCNHCPTAQAYEERIKQMVKDYTPKGVAIVAISPNSPEGLRLDELGYTDVGDSFEEMKIRAKDKDFNFPYLYDGDEEVVSRAYGPVATPHVFVFDKERKLRYQGRIDDTEDPAKKPIKTDMINALNALLEDKEVQVTTTKVFGCSTKWKEKNDWVKKEGEDWAKKTVTLEVISEAGVKKLIKNNSDKLRLINIWATWCGPCVTEYPEFIIMQKMYGNRDFEFVSISADNPDKKDKVLKFLKEKQSAVKNYIFSDDDKYKLIEAVDPNWRGALPYTILVEPGGKIVYAKQSAIDPLIMRKTIVEHKMMGRTY
jgi:peroxiredoxin